MGYIRCLTVPFKSYDKDMNNTFPILTETMHYGFRVPVKLLAKSTDKYGEEIFEAEYIGEDNKCLDWGERVFIRTGDKIKTRQMNMDAALAWRRKGY